MHMLKILIIGQLPKEIGGNYSTGAANVVYELSKHQPSGTKLYTFGTNIQNKIAKRHSLFNNQYIGYKLCLINFILDWFLHPNRTYHEWLHYIKTDHANPIRYAFYKNNIKRAIKEVNPDLIHVHSINNVSVTKFAIKGSNIPILLTCHGIFYRGEKNDIINRDRALGNIDMADYYTGLTIESTREYEQYLNISHERVAVIPNGVDCSKFYYEDKVRKEIRHAMGADDNTIVYITVASVQARKGQLNFVKLLNRMEYPYQYWIIGEGEDYDKIEKYIVKNGLSNKVILLGYHKPSELYKYYSAADIYAHVSTKEGQALCEIEAYSTGLKIVVNKLVVGTVIGDVIADDNYFILDIERPNYSSFMNWSYRRNDNRTSKSTYDWSLIVNKYVELYKSILKNELYRSK